MKLDSRVSKRITYPITTAQILEEENEFSPKKINLIQKDSFSKPVTPKDS